MKKAVKISTALLSLVLMLSMILTGSAWEAQETAYADSSSVHYLAVASDRHSTPTAIETAMSGMPDSVEYVCINGDLVDADRGSSSSKEPPSGSSPGGSGGGGGGSSQLAYNTSTIADEIKGVFPKLTTDKMSIVYGSHDANATDDAGIMKCADVSRLPAGSDSSEISAGQSGLIYAGPDGNDADTEPDYYVYGVSFYDMQKTDEASVTDESGAETAIADSGAEAAAAAFESWVDEINKKDPDVPVIVIGHVPLHYKRKDNFGATYWSNAFNYAATGSETGTKIRREVVYLHGHNHTVESTEYFVEPGETLELQGTSKSADPVTATIRYTYITAGYLRDNHTAELIKVNGSDLSFTKYKGCIVTFDSAGGSDVDSQTVQSGGTAVKPSSPTRSGWTFRGWYTEAACENKYDFSSKVSDDLTLYAGWVKGSKPSAPSLTVSVKASKNKVKLSWAKCSNASDYRVSYRKTGDSEWTKIWTNGKTSYTVSGLTKKGLYEFKVRAAAESGDRMIYSSSSGVQYRYISGLAKVKAKSGNRKVKVSWKKNSKATGYQIKYSASSSMKNAKTVNVSSSKKSYTIKKLSKNTSYYVRVRPIVKSDSNKYYGAWSSRKKATA